jgi:hypothetical protein
MLHDQQAQNDFPWSRVAFMAGLPSVPMREIGAHLVVELIVVQQPVDQPPGQRRRRVER